MVASQVHLVRHGEVANPEGVLYARLPGFSLSDAGRDMARAAATQLVALDRPVTRVVSSPLERAVESAEPIGEAFGLHLDLDPEVIEASSRLEGGTFRMDLSILRRMDAWPYLVNPLRPSWGEPFVEVAARMMAAVERIAGETEDGDAVIVTHQLPIWMVHRVVVGARLFHDPRKRRCALSSITTIERQDGVWRERGYWAPPRDIAAGAVDVGAV